MSSVYQAQGKPLSQQAIYQQKLRLGHFNSPSKPSVGVASSASDAAALLAASTDLSVKPSYERLRAAPEAHTAASSVNMNKAREPVPEPAANPDLGVPLSYNRGSVYKQAHTNSTSTMTLRISPEKLVSKHGLVSKPSRASTLDYGKISLVADKNSSLLLDKRFNPGQDNRSGLASKPIEDSTRNAGLLAAQSAGRSVTMKHGAGYTDSVSSQKSSLTFQAADVVDAALLAAASAKAKERLSPTNAINLSDLREQAQLYSKALATAQKNSEERLKAHNSGMIDLGGGLSLPASEVDKLANLIVQPVLDDLNTKASSQREFEQAQDFKQSELKLLHLKAKKDEENHRHSVKVQRLKEKDQRVLANEERKKGEDDQFVEYQTEQNTLVDTKTQELRDLQAKFAEEKTVLLTEKQENEDRIAEEEAGLIKGRKEELESMQNEKDEILKPTLDELTIENEKLKNLTDTKDQLTSEVRSGETFKAEYEAKIKELKEKLELVQTNIEATTLEHQEFFAKREATDKEVKELEESTGHALQEIDNNHKELHGEIEALSKEKEDKIATKANHKKDIHLQVDDLVKGEHEVNKHLPEHMRESIDEDKIRDMGSLFSSDEEKETKKETKKAEPKEAKKEVTPVPVKSEPVKKVEASPKNSSKKKGFRARLKSAFQPPVASKQDVKTPKESNAASSKTVKADRQESISTSNFDDEISIRGNQNTKGHFKEEI
ncbi:hypothetical protein METBIDRAFT_9074 [Metschnikowia bicuspidata var. bicuspidata NRRL YB-4993]|uniref:Eisosome protein 1 n=1 Tax=Metschnikowia bicuspidata var. bicuspidata NRRL YB-4993 TaxID=869754 RepID=A0A1A0HFN0_9ASCO|nr:hypothetical protein METBIDRAFT_9074 [Metschnikowia bicuspidata var. bicuspidata NRRL YB-4993]OBA22702.1 hypothetical protein METBIDRAFT_9074 [Metschnikowia bicuspidata var. bicuspidata NRRL YB-4993]